VATRAPDLFREEALEKLRRGGAAGDLLRLSPAWTRIAYWVVLVTALTAAGYATFGQIGEYARGEAVVTREPAAASDTLSVTAFLPGELAPLLSTGMPLHFALRGFPKDAWLLRIDAVADALVTRAEALRQLGRDDDGALPPGPLMCIHAHLPSLHFVSDGRDATVVPGGNGQVEVRLGSHSILQALFPSLMTAKPRHDG